jgi:hypothetical protein
MVLSSTSLSLYANEIQIIHEVKHDTSQPLLSTNPLSFIVKENKYQSARLLQPNVSITQIDVEQKTKGERRSIPHAIRHTVSGNGDWFW